MRNLVSKERSGAKILPFEVHAAATPAEKNPVADDADFRRHIVIFDAILKFQVTSQ